MNLIGTIVGLLAVFLVGVVVGERIDSDILPVVERAIVPGFVTLAAAFFGARYAFDLQESKAQRETDDARVAAGNRAIFTIIRKYNHLRSFERDFLKPFKGDPTAFLQMPPLPEPLVDESTIDFESISFLLETDHRNILGELSAAILKYQSVMDAINARSRLHLAEAQPAVEKAGLVEGGNYSFEDIENALGPRIYKVLVQGTEQVFEHTEEMLTTLERLADKLYRAMKSEYPNKVIIQLAPENDVDNAT